MAERPLYTLYKNLKAQNYDVPNDYNKFESALTRDGKSGANNRHAIYENLKAQNFDVPDTYERFYTALFEPRSKTSSRAKGGSVPMSAADRARFLSGAAAISASAKQIANNAGRYNRLKQRKQKQQKDFGRVNLGTHLTPFGGDANNVVKDEFAYNPETGKAGAYVTSDNENAYTQSDAEQKQAILDKYGEEWNKAVDMGMVPSELDKADPGLSDTDVAMRQMERRQEWLDENQNRRSQELNESMHLQDSPFVASGGAVAPSSFNAAIGNEANRLSDAEYGAYNTAKAYNQMLRTTLLQELKEQKQRNEDAGWWKDKWNDVSNYFGGMFDTMLAPKLYSQGVMDAAMANNMLQVKKGMEDGTIKKGSNAGEAAQVMLSAIQQQQGESAKQQQYGAKAYQYGDVSGRSLKFMGDFALSGWRNVMTTGFTKAGEKVGEKMALGALGKWFTKNTGRVLGDMAGSAALAATNQLGSTYNNVIERYVGMNNENGGVTQDKDGNLSFNKGVSLGKAIKDGLGSATIENFSEMFGEYLPGASKILSKLGLSKVSSFFEKIGNNACYKWLSNATNKSGIQGVMSEIAEEEFGTALHAAWGDGDGSWSDFNVFTNPDAREKQIDTCLGMFYSVGFMQSPRTAVGAINAVRYFNLKHQVTKADKFGQMMFNDKWDEIKNKIDVTTNADLTKTVLDATRSDSMNAKQKGAVINYAMFLSKLRGFNQASDAKTKDKVEEGETAPTLSNDLDDAYTEGHNADDADKHDIQIQHEDQAKTLAAALNISEQQLSGMSDEELESLTGQEDKLDQAIYDYQLSSARYQGVVDDAQDKVDLAAHQAEQRVNMYTDQSRGSVRNATIKASGGAEDYGVYIISGNIATHEDGSIDVSNSDDMILYFDPTTNSVEHADALMFAELGEELPADAVKAQAVADAKENAIKEVAGIIDGTVDVGSQFSVTDADGTEHTYEVLADNGDGTAMITIDGNVPTELVKGENVQIPYSFEDLQKMKDIEDKKRLEAAKAEREQMEKERGEQQTEETQPSFDFNQILNDNGNVVLVDVLGKDGNTQYPGSTLFLIRDAGAKAKVVELKSDGTIVPHAVNKEDVATISSMSLDEYKQAMPSSMIEDNSGGNRGEMEVEAPTIEGEAAGPAEETAAPESSEATTTEQTPTAEQTPAITLEDGTIVPMLEDGNPDFSKLSAAQTAELYDSQFGEDADGIVSGYVSDAKKALDKANNMTVKGKTFVEQKAAKDAKEKAIADAQAAYDSAVAIRDAYNERQLAKEENTPEGRKSLIEKARRKYARLKNSEEWSERSGDLWNETVGKLLHRLYDATGIDVFDDTPNTVYEYVAANVGPYSLNYEGNDNSKGVQQETGLSRSDFAKLGWLAAEGKGMTIDAKVHRLWENRPSNLESADTQEIRNALISLITSGQTAFQARDYILNQRIELAESALEEQLRQEEDAAEAQRVKEEEEKKKAEEEKTNENRNAPELSNEQQKAKEKGEKLGFPAVDKEGEPINQNVIELANWAKEQGLEIDPTSKLNSYADLYVMCKNGFGVSTLVPDVGENINQVFYLPDNVQGEQLLKLQEEFNVGRDLKHSADMNSEITEGAMFYDGDTAREFKEFVDKKVEKQNKVFGEQRPEEDLPFSAKENGQQQTTAERAADVEKNKVDDIKVVDNIVGQKTRKAFDRLAKMMGAEIQWQYSDKLGNGWIQETTDADGNVHRTIFITLDSSITEGAQFIFGHEMTHQIKSLNPAAYNELTQLVLDTYGSDAFDKAVDETMKRYSDAGFSGRDREYYAEEVVADAVGEMIRDLNLAHTLAMKMSHPLLAAIHEILQKVKLAFYGTEYSDVTKNIIRSIEQAYVKTAKGEVTNSETGEDVSFSLRQKPEPKKKGIGYKVFVLKDGKLYPPMVANPNGAATPVGVWLDADAAPIAGESKTGRPQVKQGGKGTQGGSGKLAYRPGWHLGVVPYAIQFNRKDAEGNKTLFPKNFVFAEVEYAADVDYQEEARQEGINPSGKYQHSLAGLKHLPTDGYYMYRTNPNPETDPWVITGAMKVNRILTRAEQAELVKNAGREPQQIQEGDIVTDDVVNSINQEIADAPKFSLKVYHGSGADFTEFDFDHMGEGAGSQTFGWGGYVTSSKKIGKNYATLMDNDPSRAYYRIQHSNGTRFAKKYPTLESFLHGDKQIAMNDKFTEQEKIDFYNEMKKLAEPYHNLYEVDIPDDNGSNYLDWDKPLSKKQQDAIREGLEHLGVDIKKLESKGQSLERTGENVYNSTLYIGLTGTEYDLPEITKGISTFLSSVGFTGIKYKAGRNFGGAKKGDTNYVIFKPEDMKITQHTKFSIKTYHGSQSSFDHFDHSFMGSGEGAQAYGWGTYVSEVEGIAKAYAKQNAKKNAPSRLMYQGKPMTYKTPSIIYQVAFNMDKFNISAKEAISKMIDADEKKLASVGDTPFAKMKAKQDKDELKVLKGLNPSDFKINDDYDTVAQNLTDTKSGLDLLEDELKDAKSYVDLYQSRLDEAKEELSKAKESGTGLGVDMYESDVMYYSEQVEKYKQTVKTKESDIKDVKTKIDALQKKLDSMEKTRNLYSVDIPDDTGDNYIGWDEPITPKMLEAKRRVMEEDGYTMYDSDGNYDYFEKTENGKYQYWQLWNRQKGNGLYNELSKVLHSDKLASLALNKQGIVGVKVIADRTTGGNKEGKMNYVIFDENNAQITSHTKFSLRLKSAIEETETSPSDAQKESGNYKKGHIKFGGYDYTIENPKGSTRSGKDANGKEWKVTMHDTYGYIRGKFGKDGDHLDMFINDKADLDNWNGDVFVVDQVNPDGSFDEHKVMYGYDSMNDAEKAYLANYSKGWKGLGNITGASKDEFDKWLDTSNRKLKPFADYANVKFSQAQSVDNEEPKTFEEFLNHPSLKFSIKNEEQRKAAENAYEYASKLRPNEYAQYAIVDMSKPSKIPEYYEKKVLADNWRRFYNRAVHNELNDVRKKAWGNYKLFDLDRPFADQVNEVKGKVPDKFNAPDKVTNKDNIKGLDRQVSSAAEPHYSLKDEKTLAGVHNITEEKLLKAIKQGGLANPSVAVIDSSKQNHEDYGDISLILPSDKVAKRTGKNAGTWQGDAWTPTYPQVERQMSNKGAAKASKDVSSVPGDMYREVRRGLDRWLDGGEANSAMAYMFLSEKGVAPEPKKIQHKFGDDVYNELKSITTGDFNIYGIGKADAQKVLDMYIDAKFDGDKDLYEEKTKAWLERNNSIVDAGDKGGMRYTIAKDNVELYDEYGFNYKSVQTFVRDVEYDHRKTGVDMNATLNDVEDYIKTNNLTDEFNTWLEGKEKEYGIKEVIFDGFTPSGNRRYVPNTLENVSKIMKKQGRNGATGISVSFQNFAASLMPSYGTLKDIRSKKGLLTSDYEDLDKFNEKWSKVFFELGMKCQPDATGTFDDYGLARLSEAAKTSDPQAYLKKEYNVDFSDEDTKRLKEMVKAIKEESPAMYFETKFERPVGFNEFSSAVVPTTASDEVKQALQNAGVQIYEYDKEKEGDRSRAFNEAINSSDNIRFSLKAMMEKPEGWKQANKKAIHIAEAIERDPKFSLKNLDGTLIKAGTYFSGGGLVEEGLKGIIDPVVAVEYDEKISGVYRNNFGQHIVTADVRDVDPKELVKQIDGEVEYFHASPVCKNYSQAKSNHAEVELDKETAASTAEFINAVKPKVVTIENVKGYKDSDAMKTITDALDANGYTWDADVYNAADYGGYTNRERLIVRAVRDGKLPAKPEKMARKSGWYEAVADIIPTLTEKKNGVAPWMDIRLKADGIDWRNIDKPLYVMGSAYADGKIPHAFADELLPTLRTKSGDVIVMPDGKVYRAMGRVLARVSGVSDDYKMPFSENLSHTIIGNGIPTQLTEHVIAPLLQNTLHPTTPEDGNTKFSLRYDKFENDLNQWKKDNNLPKDAKRPTIPQRNAGESAVDFLRRVDEYRKQMALWKTAPTYEQHLLSNDTALGEFNRELQRGSVLKRIAFQDSMLAIRKAQEAIMKEVGVDRLNMAEDAYTAENRSHGKGKNEFEEYNNEFLQPLRKAYHQMKKVLGDSYDNVRLYMMAKHGLERNAQMAFKESLEADYEDVAQRSAAYKAYKGDISRMGNDSGFELGLIDYATWVREDNAIKMKYSPSYMKYRYDKMGITFDYSGLSALFDGSDFEEAAHKLVRDIESKHIVETKELWDATNAATKKILRDGYKAGMMSKDTYQYVRDMYSHYIPLRGWDGTTADQVWDYVGGGNGAFNQTLKKAHGRTSIADDPIAYIENMAESGILLNNKNWVKQHLMLLAQNHPTSLLTLSKAWYVKSADANGNEEWIPATPQITSQMNSNQVKAAIDAFEQKMEQMEQTGDATQKRDGLNIAYPQTHSEEREHEVRVMKDGEEYVIYVNGDPQLAQAMNNTRAHRVREIQSGKLDRAAAWLGRKMAAAYTSLSPLFIPSNYFRDLTMTLASTAIREDGRYNYLLRKNLATSWNLGFMLRDYQNGKLREKVSNGNATPKEQMFYDFMMNGGETGFVSSLDVEDLKKKFKNDLKDLDRWKTNPVKVGHTIMDGIEFLNRAIEDSNRFAVYMTSIQYGRSIDEAVNDAKDVTLNFNRKGTGEYGWQMIRNLYLFINPAVQSLQTLGALVKHHPFKFTAVTASWLASGVLVPIVNAALMSLLGGDDDKDKYWQFTKWDRRNNLIMWIPFTHEYVKIPLAQEFRAFYGVGDMIASKMMGGELAEESWSQYAEDLLGQVVDMLPLDPTGYDGNIAVSLMPNAIRPIFELAFNVDFTGKPLFKDTEYNKYDPNFTKAYVGTPDWLVRASRMVNSIGNDYPDVQQNSIDAFGDPRYNLNNPGVVDHVLSSYLGGAYTMGSQVLGVLTKSLNDPKEIKVADIPLFSKFVSNPDDRPVTKKQGDEFWDMKENHDRAANTLSKLKKQAKVDGDYSMLERFYGSEEYKQYKQDDMKVKKYEEDKKKERAEESGEEYRPHKLNAEDIYKAHATPKDDFEDLKLKQLYTKLNGFKSTYDLLVDTAPSQSDGYYNTNKAAIDAIDEISLDKQEISELKKGFLDDGKDAYNAEDMKRIRELRKKVLAVLEKANKVVVANQKAKKK